MARRAGTSNIKSVKYSHAIPLQHQHHPLQNHSSDNPKRMHRQVLSQSNEAPMRMLMTHITNSEYLPAWPHLVCFKASLILTLGKWSVCVRIFSPKKYGLRHHVTKGVYYQSNLGILRQSWGIGGRKVCDLDWLGVVWFQSLIIQLQAQITCTS